MNKKLMLSLGNTYPSQLEYFPPKDWLSILESLQPYVKSEAVY